MVAEPRQYPIEGAAIRAWAREAVASAQQHVFIQGFNNAAGLPQVVVESIGGEPWTLYQLSCYAATQRGAEVLAADVETELAALARFEHEDAVILGAVIEMRRRFRPDENSDTPCYVIDARFVTIAREGP